ncbi:hypothetical protein ACQP2P_01465 [Dactylosporangium sp. CA-139114]|uniref:hypothetical protein n=1 Tax=Dactylosporangium sp. CA-139114 TaxID=3239931 RepID=UPI003D999B6B
MGQLDDAAKAFRAADTALTRAKELAAQRIEAARAARIEARDRLHAAIVAEALAGVPQVDIIRRSGYSRDRVRTILRAGGVEAE